MSIKKTPSDLKSGRIRPYSIAMVEMLRVTDGVSIYLSLRLAFLFSGEDWASSSTNLLLLTLLTFFIIASISPLYRSWRTSPLHDEFVQVLFIWASSAFLANALIYFSNPVSTLSLSAFISWVLLASIMLTFYRIVFRVVLRSLRKKGRNYRTAGIIGNNALGVQLADSLSGARWMGIRFEGFYDDRELSRADEKCTHPTIGNTGDVISRGQANELDIVYITLPMSAESRIREIIRQLSDTTVSVYYVPNFFTLDLLRAEWSTIQGIPLVSVVETPFRGINKYMKRLEDIVLSSIILLFISIPLLLISAGIKITSPGPVIYKQKRYGLDGKEFTIWKFRSMHVQKNDMFVQATKNDSRITSFGSFLRKTSLDELPQFINVLQGKMSIVGPRPHPIDLNEHHRKLIHRYMVRHIVKPGITGWAQINGYRGETDTLDKMENRIEFDLDYIRHWSIGFDLKIVFMTIFNGFINRNAY